MFIDIHGHSSRIVAPIEKGQTPFSSPEQLIERYDKIGIEKAVLLPIVSPEGIRIYSTNEEVLDIAKQYPDRFIPFCSVDPRAMTNSPDAPLGDVLAHYRDKGCKGIGEVTANLPFSDPRVQNLFRHVQDIGFPLTFHIASQIGGMYGLYDDPGLPQLERSLIAFPSLRFLGHSQAFWAEIGPLDTPADRYAYPDSPIKQQGVVPKLMRRYENLYGDLSAGSGHNALARDVDHAVQFLNEFQDRLLFGTDITTPGKQALLPDFLLGLKKSKKISQEVFEKVARGNAIKLLNLK